MIRVAALVLAVVAAPSAHALQVRDDRGAAISLERPPERIVSLAPHLAQIAFAAGAGTRLVGVSAHSRYPPEAARLPAVASSGRVDVERLITLRPQLVLAWKSGNPALQIARLESLGIPVLVTEVRSLADIPRVVRLVGALAGSTEVAEARARKFERELAELRERYASERSIAVFLEVWHAPMLTVSGEHLVSHALTLCGGRNVFARARGLTSLVSREQLLAASPRAIVTTGPGEEAPGAWRGLEALAAVRDHRIYAMDPDLLYDQGPRFIEGVRALCARLDLARN